MLFAIICECVEYACVINTNHLKMSNTKQFLCHITFLFYYTHAHARISYEKLLPSTVFFFIQMDTFFCYAPILPKEKITPVNSNLQFCVPICILNIHIHTGPYSSVECELRESTLKTKHHVLQQTTNSK